jgi:hypothetical protein
MTGRDDLGELHALAAEISDDAHGWRAHRRHRALERAEKRSFEASVAPVMRRKRHRAVAGAVVVLVAAALVGAGLEIHRSSHHHAPPTKSVTQVPGYQLADIRAGRQAAQELSSQGRIANVFSCEAWFDAHHLVVASGQSMSGFHAGFLHACTNAAINLEGSG